MSWYLVDGSSLLVPIGLRGSWLPRRRKEGTYGLDLVAFSWSNMYNYKCYKCLWWNFEHFSLRSNMNWSAPCVGIMHLAPPLRAGGESLGKAAQLLVFSFSSVDAVSRKSGYFHCYNSPSMATTETYYFANILNSPRKLMIFCIIPDTINQVFSAF